MSPSRSTFSPPTLAIVGAGRVGRAFGHLLHELGWPIAVVVTRSRATARAAVRSIAAGQPYDSLTHRILAADVILLSTPDDAIAPTAARLARIGGAEWRGKVVLHCSGALDSSVLAPLARLGAFTGSVHPFQAFSTHSAPSLSGALFTIEGHPAAIRVARRIALALEGTPVRLDARLKPAYHLAGGFAAAHLVATLEAATQLLIRLGYTRRQALRGLVHMARHTIENLEHFGPAAALSGPLARGDFRTIEKHVAALRSQPRALRDAYSALMRLGATLLSPHPAATLRRLNRLLSRMSRA